MGWNWVRQLAQHCNLTVITEEGFREGIEEYSKRADWQYSPSFKYIDIGPVARKQFWAQGDWRFYYYYRRWQQQAYELACKLCERRTYDIVHQLNMIGYREPGFLWQLPLPLVWGPIGGHAQMPTQYLPQLGMRAALAYGTRNVLNCIQMRSSLRVRRAMKRASALVAATEADRHAIRVIHKRQSLLIGETGCDPLHSSDRPPRPVDDCALRIVWVGVFNAGKALPIGLDAVARVSSKLKVELHIVGTGIEEKRWRSYAEKCGVSRICIWHGRVAHNDALRLIGSADCLLFTSLQEGTPHVVLEALGAGVPVICHDSCGHGASVDKSCGIKIVPISPGYSVDGFSDALLRVGTDRELLRTLSAGALARADSLRWAHKAEQMLAVYGDVIGAPVRTSALAVVESERSEDA